MLCLQFIFANTIVSSSFLASWLEYGLFWALWWHTNVKTRGEEREGESHLRACIQGLAHGSSSTAGAGLVTLLISWCSSTLSSKAPPEVLDLPPQRKY